MYLRVTKRRNQDGTEVEYYQLAESAWNPEAKRSEVKVVHNFGRADELDREALVRLIGSIRRVLDGGLQRPEELRDADIEIEGSRPLGGALVARALWEELGLGAALRARLGRRRDAAPHETALFAMVANRLLEPCSKRACHDRWLADGVHLPEAEGLTREQLYRAMDFLEDHAEALEEAVFFRTADLFHADVDLIFWDTTTIHFEVDEADEEAAQGEGSVPALRRRGKSKEKRGDVPQVIVGLAVTRDGLPVRSWVFPGNTVDATTVKTIRAGLVGWKLGRSVFVGDAGMDSEKNRDLLAKGLGRYILAMPVGRLKEVQEEVVTRAGRYKVVSEGLEVKEVVVGDGERRRRYVVCRNPAEAVRQREHRERVLEDLAHELERMGKGSKDHPRQACQLLASGRYGKYLSTGAGGRPRIDRAKVRDAERMDGRYVLLTNDDTLSLEDVAQGYKSMAIIESCFRRMKTTGLRIRPVYHWTPSRIVSHVKLGVFALLLQRAAEIRAKDTWANLRHELDRLQAVTYRAGDKRIVQTTRPTPKARKILASLGAATPKSVLSVEDVA